MESQLNCAVRPDPRIFLRRAIAACVIAFSPHWASAGGSPETTLIVVNGDSPLSVRIANAYARMRDIPQSHLVWLHDVQSLETIRIDKFRDQIWGPIRDFISNSAMEDQIDTIAYSADFPYAVNVKSDIVANELPKNQHRGSIASLTGLTYFARRVEIGDAGYLNLYANQYYRRNLAPISKLERLSDEQSNSLDMASKAFKKKDFEGAVKLYSEIAHTGFARIWYDLARSLAALDRNDEAMAALEKAVNAGWGNSMDARRDKFLKPLKSSPQFTALLGRMEKRNGPFEAAHGFRSRYYWDRWNLPSPLNSASTLNRYFLSTLLAYTGLRGNSVPEILGYLSSAASSDGSHPYGTAYLMVNGNVRSKARQRYFPATVKMLEERKRRAEILVRGTDGQNGIIPIGKNDVIGVVAGAQSFDWRKSGSTLLPGAIAESLTSYGGHFNSRKQTKLSEFLRYGAAGSSGAVAEPYAIQEKFPVAMIHAYYAEGFSLAEAFYQSISGPYQLIIVGDPLARPFAYFARVEIAEPDPSQNWRGAVAIRPRVIPATRRPIERVELWVDGVYVAEAPVGGSIPWDTRSVDDGSHEIRLVAVEANRIETRSYTKHQIWVSNTTTDIEVQQTHINAVLGDPISVSGLAKGAQHVDAVRGLTILASGPVHEDEWRLSLPSDSVGLGTVPIVVRAGFSDGSTIRSHPVTIHVSEPPREKPIGAEEHTSEGLKGILTTHDGKKVDIVVNALDGNMKTLNKKWKREIKNIQLEGAIQIRKSGFYQFVVGVRGRIRIKISNQDFGTRDAGKSNEIFLPVSLEAGWHKILIEYFPDTSAYLKVLLSGEDVANILAGDMLRHASPLHVRDYHEVDKVGDQTSPPKISCEKVWALQSRIEALRTEYKLKLDKLTEKHPDMVDLARAIRDHQAQAKDLDASGRSCITGNSDAE